MKLDDHNSKYELFVDRVTQALVALKADATPVTNRQIYQWVSEHHPEDVKLLDPSWGSHMSGAIRDESTRIRRVPGRFTYRLLATAPEDVQPPAEAQQDAAEPDTGEQVAAEQAKYTKREAALYPTLCDWLAGRGFRAEDTSWSKSGGTWGNPDVTGIRVAEGFVGHRELEVATIEAKTSMASWRQYVFEAVSHKRFAHRAYFAFAIGSDEPSLAALPEAEALRQYGERFRVGILVVFLPEDVFGRLHKEKIGEVKIDSAEVRVEELWPAIYEPIRSEDATNYLWKVLSLESDEALYEFGRE